MLIAVRHARTSFNEDGSERLRGWLAVPLSAEGLRESAQTAQFLKAHDPKGVSVVLTSPLKRAMQTAQIIGRALSRPVTAQRGLLDWNVGSLAGRPVMDTLPLVHQLMQARTTVPPGGESYGAFEARVTPFLRQLILSPAPHLAVTHNRVLTLLTALVHGDRALILQRGPVEPGGVVAVTPQGQMTVLFKGREEAHERQEPTQEQRSL